MLKKCPFPPSLPKALMTAGKEPFPTIYVDSQKENEVGWTQNSIELYFVMKFSQEDRGVENNIYLSL